MNTNLSPSPFFLHNRPFRNVIAVFLSFTILLYVLCYAPFIFLGYLDSAAPQARFMVEGACIVTLILLVAQKSRASLLLWISFAISCNLILLLNMMTFDPSIRSYISTFLKFIFAVLLWELVQNRRCYFQTMNAGWHIFSLFVVFCGLFGLLNMYLQFPFPLSIWNVTNTNWIANYEYYNFSVLGNFIVKRLASSNGFIPRFTYWATEPGILSFLFASSIALLLTQDIPKKQKIVLIALNFIGGILTLSVNFFLLLIVSAAITTVRAFRRRDALLLQLVGCASLIALLLLLALNSDIVVHRLLHDTSWTDRGSRAVGAIRLLFTHGSWETFLFGSGIGSIAEYQNYGSSCGFIDLIVERGILITVLVCGLCYKLVKHSMPMTIIVVIYGLTFNMFWWPYFWIPLVLASAQHAHKNSITRTA